MALWTEPLTKKQKVDSSKVAQTYAFAYLYEDSNHPTAPSQIGHNHYIYDANGNPFTVTDSTSEMREMYRDDSRRCVSTSLPTLSTSFVRRSQLSPGVRLAVAAKSLDGRYDHY